MPHRIELKIDNIVEDINEVKIAITKLESSYEQSINILDRLTNSVEHHIRRTDELQDVMGKFNIQQELLKQKVEDDKSRHKLIYVVLGIVGTVILGLKQLGILDKLF